MNQTFKTRHPERSMSPWRFGRSATTILGFLALLAAQLPVTPADAVGVASYGPLNEHGFPFYYMDRNGLALESCDDPADPLCPLDALEEGCTEPNVAIGCYWHETIYFLALTGTPIARPDAIDAEPGTAIFKATNQSVFTTPDDPIQDGDQTVFSRIRFRVDCNPVPACAGTWRLVYPYGEEFVEVTEPLGRDGQGTRCINITWDCLHGTGPNGPIPGCGFGFGNHFTTPLDDSASVSHYLRWTPQESAPAGYIGDAITPHAVEGAPYQAVVDGVTVPANFYRVEAPVGCDIGGPGINFIHEEEMMIAGKVATICGDGFVDAAADEDCDDGSQCTDGTDCTTDPLICAGIGDGTCAPRGGDCCSATCEYEASGSACDDRDVCTTNSTCDAAGFCQIASFNDGTACDDGNACTTADTCDATGLCVGGAPLDCDDLNVCTTDSCAPATGCQYENNSEPCNDGIFCNGTDTCSGGSCSVNAGDPCAAAGVQCQITCDEVNDICEDPAGTPCDDGLFCNGSDTCNGGTCSAHAGDPCVAAGVQCQITCDEASDICLDPAGTSCDDSDACTTNDACDGVDGICVGGAAPDCNDLNLCTADSCDSVLGCVNDNVAVPCDDGDACTVDDTCSSGSCAPGSPRNCDDNNPCTVDTCDSLVGCLHTPTAGSCDDGDSCTLIDVCNDQTGECIGTELMVCEDNDDCTDNICDATQGCLYLNNTASCEDGDPTTTGDTCSAGICEAGFIGCPSQPVSDCRGPAINAKSRLVLTPGSKPNKRKMRLKYGGGQETLLSEFGSPTQTDGTDYLVCIYDDMAGSADLVLEAAVAPGSAWTGKPFGYVYKNQASASGIRSMKLKYGIDGKAGIVVGGKGANLASFSLPLADPVRAQIVNDLGGCWEASFAGASVNRSSRYLALGGMTP